MKRTLLVIISADKGLAGSFGASLMKGVQRFMEDRGLTNANASLITIGRKAHEYFEKRGFEILAHHERWSDGIDFDDVRPLAALIKDGYGEGKFDDAHVIYTHFISTLKQKVFYEQLLPVSFESVEAVVKGILPESGKYSNADASDAALVPEVTFEPSPEEVLSELVPALFNIQIFHSVLESNASEHSARMIAMKNASDNAGEIGRSLKLYFNKERQAAITREVSEIVGGMESMRVIDA